MRGRRTPYTQIGLKRIPCAKCGKPSRHQWQICADGNTYRGLCPQCDVELNALVMRWVWGDTREADIAAYMERRLG